MDPENENFMSDLSHVMIASQYLGEAAAMANATMSHSLDLFNEDKEKCLLHIVEDIEECIYFFLCSFFTSKKLYIVDEEDINSAKSCAHLIDFSFFYCVDILRNKLI